MEASATSNLEYKCKECRKLNKYKIERNELTKQRTIESFCNEEFESQYQVIDWAIMAFGDLGKLKRQNEKFGEFTSMQYNIGFAVATKIANKWLYGYTILRYVKNLQIMITKTRNCSVRWLVSN